MLKRIFCFILIAILLISCNNTNVDNQANTSPDVRAHELLSKLEGPESIFISEKDKDSIRQQIIDLYTIAIHQSTNPASLYISRGFIYSDLEMYDESIKDYTEALRIEPGASDALKNRGIAHEQKGDFSLAIQDFEVFLDEISDMPTERREWEREVFSEKIEDLKVQLREKDK